MNAQQKGWETRRRRAAEKRAAQVADPYNAALAIERERFESGRAPSITIAPASTSAAPIWSAIVLLLALIITGAVMMVVVGNG